ncbi:MAG TPA: T9SS type A sorting domain-containing protein, partial [Flavobacteriales bacterium]|nr:T9SS type A sorting domain-containing protein [Flavobacteriales bacterium]
GLVSFRIRPQLPLLAGTVIENTANIYFDFNPPVITEPSVLVAEVSTEVAEGPDPFPLLWPNPAEGALFLSMDVGSLQAFMILDPVGRVVKRGTLRPGGTSVIDISGLSAGGYLLRTSTGERTVQRAFIVR